MIDKKYVLLGVIVGFITPMIAFVLWIVLFTHESIEGAIFLIKKGNLYSESLSLSAVSNMIAFYLLLNTKKINIARGVIVSTMIIAVTVVIMKLF